MNSEIMKTRQALVEDAKSIGRLFNQYRQFYKQGDDVPAAERFISDRLKNKESIIFVVEDEVAQTLVGFAQLYPSFSSVSMKPVWILNDLFTDPAYRGKGVGKMLLSVCFDWAQKTKSKGLTLRTAQDNHVAQKLYESMGWKKDNVYLTYHINV